MIAAAEPSETPEQSKMPRFPAINGELAMVSIETSFLNCARGFRAPFLWFFHAIRDITSLSFGSGTPYLFAYAGASSEKLAGADVPEAVPSLVGAELTRPE